MNSREREELAATIRRVVDSFEMEDGLPFAEVHGAAGVVWGQLGEEQCEALQDLLSVLEELEDE